MDLITYWQRYCAPYLKALFGRDERGASLVEYVLLVALIALAAIVGISFLSGKVNTTFSKAGSSLT